MESISEEIPSNELTKSIENTNENEHLIEKDHTLAIVEDKVKILNNAYNLSKVPHRINQIGIILERPVHPSTWYRIGFQENPSDEYKCRPSSFQVLGANSVENLSIYNDNHLSLQSNKDSSIATTNNTRISVKRKKKSKVVISKTLKEKKIDPVCFLPGCKVGFRNEVGTIVKTAHGWIYFTLEGSSEVLLQRSNNLRFLTSPEDAKQFQMEAPLLSVPKDKTKLRRNSKTKIESKTNTVKSKKQKAMALLSAQQAAFEKANSYALLLSIVTLSKLDKAPQLKLSSDLLECEGAHGGYRMIRATNGVASGSYYFEVEILDPINNENAHTRIGWSSRQGDLQGPVGYDKYSYGYRDIEGSCVHDSERVDSYGESYSPGDVVGCYINLNDYDHDMNEIRFFKNGKDQGAAYRGRNQVPSRIYFPAVSLFMEARVRVNFGPSFIIKPEISTYFNPVSEIQPMSPVDRRAHEERIANIKSERAAKFAQSDVYESMTQNPKILNSHEDGNEYDYQSGENDNNISIDDADDIDDGEVDDNSEEEGNESEEDGDEEEDEEDGDEEEDEEDESDEDGDENEDDDFDENENTDEEEGLEISMDIADD